MTHPTTIKDIARILNISTSTVSRALADHSDVSPKTKKAVLETAQKMDYQPNLIAQSLKTQTTNNIGVIIPQTVNRFFSQVISGIQEVASEHKLNVIICQSNESYEDEVNNVHTLLSSRVCGLLVSLSANTKNYEHLKRVKDKGIPLIFFDRAVNGLDASMVITDNYQAAFDATCHLIENGCKRIARIAGPQNLSNARSRLYGYIDALKRYDYEVDEDLIVYSNFQNEDAEPYVDRLLRLDNPPDAIFAINDSTAIQIIHILSERGISVPEEISVMGFNNEKFGNFITPTLTTVACPAYDIGKGAAELLWQELKDPPNFPIKKVIPSNLIVRDSTHKSLIPNLR